jgi:uncharacterized protein YbaA (DUF1428 family)
LIGLSGSKQGLCVDPEYVVQKVLSPKRDMASDNDRVTSDDMASKNEDVRNDDFYFESGKVADTRVRKNAGDGAADYSISGIDSGDDVSVFSLKTQHVFNVEKGLLPSVMFDQSANGVATNVILERKSETSANKQAEGLCLQERGVIPFMIKPTQKEVMKESKGKCADYGQLLATGDRVDEGAIYSESVSQDDVEAIFDATEYGDRRCLDAKSHGYLIDIYVESDRMQIFYDIQRMNNICVSATEGNDVFLSNHDYANHYYGELGDEYCAAIVHDYYERGEGA